MKSSETGFKLEAIETPIMNDYFMSKLGNENENKKKVEIFYINLGDLLTV